MNESIKENASKKMAFSVFCKDKVNFLFRLLECIFYQKM